VQRRSKYLIAFATGSIVLVYTWKMLLTPFVIGICYFFGHSTCGKTIEFIEGVGTHERKLIQVADDSGIPRQLYNKDKSPFSGRAYGTSGNESIILDCVAWRGTYTNGERNGLFVSGVRGCIEDNNKISYTYEHGRLVKKVP